MQWPQIRELFPSQWVVMEAVNAHPQGEVLAFDELQVAAAYADGWAAWQHYQRTYLVYHTVNPILEVGLLPHIFRPYRIGAQVSPR